MENMDAEATDVGTRLLDPGVVFVIQGGLYCAASRFIEKIRAYKGRD